jgi:oligoribonuclease
MLKNIFIFLRKVYHVMIIIGKKFLGFLMKKCSLLWLDLEMTGLDADKDVILEIAAIATDFDLKTIIEGPSLAIHQPATALQVMGPWVRNLHMQSGLLERVESSTVSVDDAEKKVLEFIQEVCNPEFYFAGNSIYQDRSFLKRYMPTLHTKAHYRMIDVSTLKILIKAWYPDSLKNSFSKEKNHRALDDIRESIAELRHFRKYFFKPDA